MSETAPLVTAEELEHFPDDDYRYELVEGRVIRMSPVGFEHGRTVMRLGFLIGRHLERRKLGVVLTEVGFKLKSNPDTVRAPDIAFIRQERIPPGARGFWVGPPDLAAEVLSREDMSSEIARKVGEYLRFGVPVVMIVDPDRRSVTTYRAQDATTLQSPADVLDLSDVISGLRIRVGEIFE